MSVSTLAAAGSALLWSRQQLFPDFSLARFRALVNRLAKQASRDTAGGVTFEPYLAGERTSIEQRRAAFTGLTLATTREQMLHAMIDALARASTARLDLFATLGVPIGRDVLVDGGAAERLDAVFQRDWPGRWRFRRETEASLRGLGQLVPREP